MWLDKKVSILATNASEYTLRNRAAKSDTYYK